MSSGMILRVPSRQAIFVVTPSVPMDATPGTPAIVPAALRLATAGPTVVKGAAIVAPSPAAVAYSTAGPTVLTGAATFVPAPAVLALSTAGPTVIAGTTFAPTPAALALATAGPTIAKGAATVTTTPAALRYATAGPIIAAPTYAQIVQGDNPSRFWRLDEATGTTLVDAMGAANLSLGGSGTVLGVPGVNGTTAVAFNGSGWATAIDTGNLNFAGTAPYSYEFSVYLTAYPSFYGRAVSKEDTTTNHEGHDFEFTPTGLPQMARYAGTASSYAAGLAAVTLNAWHLVIATFDGTTMKVYVDGGLMASATSTVSLNATTTPFTLAAANAGLFATLPARIDAVAIYPTALTATQVGTHYAAWSGAVAPPAPPGVSDWLAPMADGTFRDWWAPATDQNPGSDVGGQTETATTGTGTALAEVAPAPHGALGAYAVRHTLTNASSALSGGGLQTARVVRFRNGDNATDLPNDFWYHAVGLIPAHTTVQTPLEQWLVFALRDQTVDLSATNDVFGLSVYNPSAGVMKLEVLSAFASPLTPSTAPVINPGVPFTLDVHFVQSATAGSVDVYQDGVLIHSYTGQTVYAPGGLRFSLASSSASIGQQGTGPAGTAVIYWGDARATAARVPYVPPSLPAPGTPLKTLVNNTATGGVLDIPPGLYRIHNAADADAATMGPITITRRMTIRGSAAVKIRGSRDYSTGGEAGNTWTATSSYYTSSRAVPTLPADMPAEVINGVPAVNWPEQVFIDGAEQIQDAAGSTPAPGHFCLVSSGDRHIRLGTNPSGHLVEVTECGSPIFDNQAADIVIQGAGPTDLMEIRHCATRYQRGMVQVYGDVGNAWHRPSLKWLDLGYCHSANVAFYGSEQPTLQECVVHHAGLVGLDMGAYGGRFNSGYADCVAGCTIRGNWFHHNVTQGGNIGWHAGDIKITMWYGGLTKAAVIAANTFEDGPKSIWLDTRCAGFLIGGSTENETNWFRRISSTIPVHIEVCDARSHGGTGANNSLGIRLEKNKFANCGGSIIADTCRNVLMIGNMAFLCDVGWFFHWFQGRAEIAANGGFIGAGPTDYSFQGNTLLLNNALVTNTNLATTDHRGMPAIWQADNGGILTDATNGVPFVSGVRNGGNQFGMVTVSGTTVTLVPDGTGGQPRYQAPSGVFHTTMTSFAARDSGQWGGGSIYFPNTTAVTDWLAAHGFTTSVSDGTFGSGTFGTGTFGG